MHRIDSANFSTKNGLFTKGDIKNGLAPTVVSDDWLNDIQENLCQFVEGQGITLEKGRYSQLTTAIQNMLPYKNYTCPIKGKMNSEILKQQINGQEQELSFPLNTMAIMGHLYGVRTDGQRGITELGTIEIYRKFDKKWKIYLRIKELNIDIEVIDADRLVYLRYSTKSITIEGKEYHLDGTIYLKLATISF